MTHTPGPWQIKHRVNIIGSTGRSVASAGGYTTNTDNGEHILENEANARLIAAAPDLLEACKEAEDWLEEHGGDQNCDPGLRGLLRQVRSAIDKATGKETP